MNDRDRLIELMHKQFNELLKNGDWNFNKMLVGVADHLLDNGVIVLKQGVWKDNNNGTFTCSVCGGRASKMSYCGNCGAKLKERE